MFESSRKFRLAAGLGALVAGLLLSMAATAGGQDGQVPAAGAPASPVAPAPARLEGASQPATAVEPAEADLPAAYFGELAELECRYKRYSAAVALYRTAQRKAADQKEQSRYELGLAQALEAQGNQAEAEAAWGRLTQSPDPIVVSRARLTLAQRLVAKGQTDEAIKALEDIALHDPTMIFRQTAALALGQQLAASKRAAAKLGEYQDRLARNPKDRILLDLVLFLQKDDPGGRAATLALVLKALPLDIDLLDQRGQALIAAGQVDEAEHIYAALRKDFPGETRRANERLAAIAVKNGRPAEAEVLIIAASADMPDEPRTALYRARQCLALGLWPAAEKYARAAYAAVDEKTMKAAAGMELGEALFRQAKFAEARSLLAPIADQEVWGGLRQRARDLLAQFPAGDQKRDQP